MNPRRVIIALSKGLVLLLMLAGIFYYLRVRPPQDVIDDAADDLLEQTGNTYVPVHVTTIAKKTLRRFITAYGRVEPAPASIDSPAALETIRLPVTAVVSGVNCIEGQTVHEGQTLLTLASPALQQTVVSDQAAVKSAESTRDQFFADPSTPAWVRAQVDHDAEQARAVLARDTAQLTAMTFSSSITGIVTRVTTSPEPGTASTWTAVEVVDLHRLILALDVTAAALTDIRAGDQVFGDFGESKIIRVDAAVDPVSGLGSVDVALPADTTLRPGQSISARIGVASAENCLVVPGSSVVLDESNSPTIAVIDDSGRWAVREVVQTGIVEDNDVQISGGTIREGQSVVTVGAYGLTERTRVNLLKD